MEVKIIYEDEYLLAVNKPAGLVVHKMRAEDIQETLADWILEKYPEMKNVGEPLVLSKVPDTTPLRVGYRAGKGQRSNVIPRPGIVHRLDKDTSGILLVAKTQAAYLHLKKQFQNREVEKEYRAIAYGRIKEKEGVIDAPIARTSGDYQKRAIREDGRNARTEYKTLKATDEYSYLALFPKTGRTHQLRVHLKHIHHPVVCDSLYASKRECPPKLSSGQAAELNRLALHALALSFTHPNGTRMRLEAPVPAEFEQFVSKLQTEE